MDDYGHDLEIAIVGISGRFPEAGDIDAFWQNLSGGVESIRFFSEDELRAAGIDPRAIANPAYVKAGAVLDRIDLFDAAFFGYSPREAAIMDPQQRLFLECAWEALEVAGYDPATYPGRIGVYAGVSTNTYLLFNLTVERSLREGTDPYALLLANEKDFLATRVSYKLNLRGPSFTVQSACSTSLVATHLACQGLLNGECDMALVGGVTIRVPHRAGYLYQEGGILSPDGHCRAFDAQAQGTVNGNGAGVALLKRLADAIDDGDTIVAVIKGSAINNDGATKVGYTAPSVAGQSAVIAEALAVAHVPPDSVTYVETHGTGTPLGDPIEFAALAQVFGRRSPAAPRCALGSIKTNIGHLDAAAGIAGLLKTALALRHRQLPPSLHFRQPNPQIDFAHSPFYVNSKLSDWPSDGPRRAGVSSFGIGGTNAHVVLEEAPPLPAPALSGWGWQALLLSARTPAALEEATARLADYLRRTPDQDLADVAYTLRVGRRAFSHRRAIIGQSRDDVLAAIERGDLRRIFSAPPASQCPSVAFMFPGQGTQQVQMALALYRREPVFRDSIDRCAGLLVPHLGLDLREVLYPDHGQGDKETRRQGDGEIGEQESHPNLQSPISNLQSPDKGEQARSKIQNPKSKIDETQYAQPALFAIEYALAQLWMEWGVQPQAMIGHSLGEYVAACLAGVWSLADALAIVAARGRMMQEQPEGVMLSVPLPEPAIREFLNDTLDLAAVNGAETCVVSGTAEAIRLLELRLSEHDLSCRRLFTSHAFHSALMEPMIAPFVALVARFPAHPPAIPFVSNLTGDWITEAQTTDPAYWGQHLRHTVRFTDGLQTLFAAPERVLLEVGPGQTLYSLAQRHARRGDGHTVLPSLPRPNDRRTDDEQLLSALSQVWLAGVPVDWRAFSAGERRRRVPLFTYPFQRQRYWIDGDTTAATGSAAEAGPIEPAPLHERPAISSAYIPPHTPTEQAVAAICGRLLGIERIGVHDNFFELGGDSLMALQLLTSLRERQSADLQLHQVVEAATIAGIAALIDAGETAPRAPSGDPAALISKIQPHGTKPPLFFVHPAGGTVLCYHELARQLGAEQPVYGIQAVGLFNPSEHETIEEVATPYIAAVRTVQPHGPYLLGGLSYGGNVAFEMARQLQAQGEAVALLALFDSHPPVAYHHTAPDDARFLAAFPWVLGMYLGIDARIDVDELRRLDADQQLDTVIGLLRQSEALSSMIDPDEARRMFHLWKTHHYALRAYAPPPRSYPHPITLFRAIESQPPQLLELLNIQLPPGIERSGWGILTEAQVNIYDVPGSHYTMLNEPNVHTLAALLRECLETVQSPNVPALAGHDA